MPLGNTEQEWACQGGVPGERQAEMFQVPAINQLPWGHWAVLVGRRKLWHGEGRKGGRS